MIVWFTKEQFKISSNPKNIKTFQTHLKAISNKLGRVHKNIIGAIKMPNYSLLQYCDSNFGLFSIAPCKVIALNLLCFNSNSCCCLALLMAIAKQIAIVGRAITWRREIKESWYQKKKYNLSDRSNREKSNIALAILEN